MYNLYPGKFIKTASAMEDPLHFGSAFSTSSKQGVASDDVVGTQNKEVENKIQAEMEWLPGHGSVCPFSSK
jgi:hypothetical protein